MWKSQRQELVLGGHVEPTVNKQRTMKAQYLWLRSLSLLLQSRVVTRGQYHPVTMGEEDMAERDRRLTSHITPPAGRQ